MHNISMGASASFAKAKPIKKLSKEDEPRKTDDYVFYRNRLGKNRIVMRMELL